MKIYKIYQTVNNDWDTFDSAIVAAKNEDEAKSLHPNGVDTVGDTDNNGYWCNLSDVKVELIGTTKLYKTARVILASFNAG
jgi:hypothetical protein